MWICGEFYYILLMCLIVKIKINIECLERVGVLMLNIYLINKVRFYLLMVIYNF